MDRAMCSFWVSGSSKPWIWKSPHRVGRREDSTKVSVTVVPLEGKAPFYRGKPRRRKRGLARTPGPGLDHTPSDLLPQDQHPALLPHLDAAEKGVAEQDLLGKVPGHHGGEHLVNDDGADAHLVEAHHEGVHHPTRRLGPGALPGAVKIGRASCRERV